MLGLRDPQELLQAAQQAASTGDLAAADDLLRQIARIQEAELGPMHPELANTLNNLAIVAERSGRISDAETFYRRAASIASATLPPDHPMVVASHQNLEDFCHAAGLPLDAPAFITASAQDAELGLGAFASEEAASTARPAVKAPAAKTRPKPTPQPPPARTPPGTATPLDDDLPLRPEAPPAPSGGSLRVFGWVAVGALAVASGALFVLQPWASSPSAQPSPTTTSVPAAPQATPPATPPRTNQVTPPPSTAAPAAAASGTPSAGATGRTPAASSQSEVSLANVQLCQRFATGSGGWRCDEAGDTVPPGSLVFLTRVRSPRNTTVVHRWYNGDALRRSVDLRITASPNEGYRTYSRLSVDPGDSWRVEILTTDGELLQERRFTVR